jgi:hypothetical protein
MRDRLGPLLGLLGAVVVTVAVAAAAGAAAIYLTGSNGVFSCFPAVPPAPRDPIPRWILVAGLPAAGAVLVGAFFALGATRLVARLIGLALVVALGALTFYEVYLWLPDICRP